MPRNHLKQGKGDLLLLILSPLFMGFLFVPRSECYPLCTKLTCVCVPGPCTEFPHLVCVYQLVCCCKQMSVWYDKNAHIARVVIIVSRLEATVVHAWTG